MTTEIKLKEYILSKYKSIREFCMQNDFPYSTVNSIFSRGLMGSSLSIVMRVCDRLNIDVDELSNGNIIEKAPAVIELSNHERNLIIAYRSNPSMQTAVDTLLKIENRGASISDDIAATVQNAKKKESTQTSTK